VIFNSKENNREDYFCYGGCIANSSFAANDKIDEKTRRISLIIAGLILFVIMFTTYFAAISITVA